MMTVAQYREALRAIGLPNGRQLRFLRAHYLAPSRALNMTKLAKAAGYKSYHPVNLQYGILARKIGEVAGARVPETAVALLTEFIAPKQASNKDWILVMRKPFAEALKKEGWV